MRSLLVIILFIFCNISFCQSKYEKDFLQLWNRLNDEYAYFDKKQTDWRKVKLIYSEKVKNITSDAHFLRLVENVIYELTDMHITLNRNLSSSFRLIPNDTDAWIQFKNGKYIITDIRPNYETESKGIKTGYELKSAFGKPIDSIVVALLPKSFKNPNIQVKTFIANQVFAGIHDRDRVFEFSKKGITKQLKLNKPIPNKASKKLLETEILKNNIGYIKINNSLGNNNLLKSFIQAVDSLKNTKAILLDLRETSGGGNTTVARTILGKFINKEIFYQKHEYPAEEKRYGVKRSWVEIVSPQKKPYLKPVIVLVGHWTGSVGEALAVGFDQIKTAKVVGTKMAGLLGAITCLRLSETQLNICYPFEKIYHVNGTPREEYIPTYYTKNSKETYKKALELANE